MNKRFWQGFMAVMLGITLLMGSWSFQSAQMAVAEDGTETVIGTGTGTENETGTGTGTENETGTGTENENETETETVTYKYADGNGNSKSSSEKKAQGYKSLGFAEPKGQAFSSWSGSDGKAYNVGDKLPDTTLTLTAKWKDKAPGTPKVQKITYMGAKNAEGQQETSQKEGSKALPFSDSGLTRVPEGQEFSYWHGDNEKAYNPGDTLGDKVTKLTAMWKTKDVQDDEEKKELPTGDANTQTVGDANSQTVGDANTQTGGDANTQTVGDANSQTDGDANTQTVGDANSQTGGDANTQTVGDANVPTGDVEYINNGVVKTHTSDSVLSLEAAGFDADDSFTGWKDSQGTDYAVGGVFGDMVPAALYAQFEKKTTEGESAHTEAQEPKTVTVTFHAGEGSVEKTLTVGEDSMPSLYDLGLSLPDGNAFWFWGTDSSVSTEKYNGSRFCSMESVKENTPSDLYAIYGQMLEEDDKAFDIMPMSLNTPAKFAAVHYYVDSRTDESTKQIKKETNSALSPASMGMLVNGATFNHWVVRGTGTIVQSSDTISTIAPNGKDSSNQDILVLYGDWTPIQGVTLDISQTVNKEAVQRGESVNFSVTIRNTSSRTTWVRMESVVDGEISIGNPSVSGASVTGNIVTWNVEVKNGASQTLTIPVTVNANATNSTIKNTATVVKVANTAAELANGGEVRTGPTTTHTVDALTVRYNGNGGFTSSSEFSYISSNYTTAENSRFTKSGSSFVLWNTKADGTGINYRSGDPLPLSLFYVNKTVDLYAQWTVPAYSIRVTTAQGAVKVGDTIRYTIEVSSRNATGPSSIYVRDLLPGNLTYVSASPSPTLTPGGLQWQLNVPANGSSIISVSATVQAGASPFTNTAEITQINGQTADNNNFPGSSFTGSVTAKIGTQFVRYNANGGVVENTGETYYQVDYSDSPNVLDLSNKILRSGWVLTGWSDGTNTLSAGQPLTMPSSGILNLTAVWAAAPVLTLTNTPNTNYAIHGDTITYTIIVNNIGAAPATNVAVVNTLDANMLNNTEYVSHTVSTGGYDAAAGQWTISTLAANSSATLKVSYRVKSGAVDGVTMAFTAAITPAGASATARVILDIYGTGLRVTKQVTGNRASTTREFTFTLKLQDYNGNRMSGYAAYTTSRGFVGTFRMDETLTFTLRHNEHITFSNLPSGTRYTVEEINHSGYWPKQSKFSGTLLNSVTVNYVNSRRRNTNIPLTGYGDGNEELLWLMLPLLAGAAWLLINRRRKLMQDK